MSETSTSPPTDRFSRESDDGGAKEQAREQAQQGAEKAKGALRSQVDERSTTAGRQLTTQAQDARSLAEELRNQGKDGPAKLAEQAADRAERLGSYLEDNDADRLLSDVEDYARDNPWAVVAGGLAAGFLASRFLKASSSQRSMGSGASERRAPQGQLASGGTATGSAEPNGESVPTAPPPTAHPAPGPTVSAPGGTGTAGTGAMTGDGVGSTSVPGRPVGA